MTTSPTKAGATTDRELLEKAAKVADCGVRWEVDYGCYSIPSEHGPRRWNPLTDDGDALRLAVKLRMMIDAIKQGYMEGHVVAVVDGAPAVYEPREPDHSAATRRAIVRAAAAHGDA